MAGGIAEDEALEQKALVCVFRMLSLGRGLGKLTETRLKKPMTMARMPEATSSLQKGIPRDSWLVACLFMFPSMLRPRTIMDTPRKTKPCEALNMGQFFANHPRKSEHSEMTRNTAIYC